MKILGDVTAARPVGASALIDENVARLIADEALRNQVRP